MPRTIKSYIILVICLIINILVAHSEGSNIHYDVYYKRKIPVFSVEPTFKPQDKREWYDFGVVMEDLLSLTETQILESVPDQGPFVFSACPVCKEYIGWYKYNFINLHRGWSWHPTKPKQITCIKCDTTFPNKNFPMDKKISFLNPLGEEIDIPYHEGDNIKEIVVAGKATQNGHPNQYTFGTAIDDLQYRWMFITVNAFVEHKESHKNPKIIRRIALILDQFATYLPHYIVRTGTADHRKKILVSTGGLWKLKGKQVLKPKVDIPFKGASRINRKWGAFDVNSIYPFVKAYAHIKDSLEVKNLSEQKGYDINQNIEKNLIRLVCDTTIAYPWKKFHFKNNLVSYISYLREIGQLINEPEYIHFAYQWSSGILNEYEITVDGLTGGGFAYATGRDFSELARQLEGYSDPEGFVSKTDGMHLSNVNLIENNPVYEKVIFNAEKARLPNGGNAPFHDTHYNYEQPGWRKGAGIFLYPTPRPHSETIVMPGFGHIMFGDGTGDNQIQTHFHYSRAGEHPHSDTNSLFLYAYGREMFSDLGYFHHALRWWTGGTYSHNLVTIDEKKQFLHKTPANIEIISTNIPGISIASVEGKRAYPELAQKYRRTIINNTQDINCPYIVDIFEVEGGSQHDYLLHGGPWKHEAQVGSSSLKLTKLPQERPLSNGKYKDDPNADAGYSAKDPFGMFTNIKTSKASKDFYIDFIYKDDSNIGTRTYMFKDPKMDIYLGESLQVRPSYYRDPKFKQGGLNKWNGVYEDKMPQLIARYKGKRNLKSIYVAIHEPFKSGPKINNVKRIETNNSIVALEINFKDRKDTLIYQLIQEETQTLNIGQIRSDARFAYVSKNKETEKAAYIAGTQLKTENLNLNSTKAYYKGQLLDSKRKFDKEKADILYTEQKLPEGSVLNGNWIIITYPGQNKYTICHQIEKVEFKNGLSAIYTKEDHGLRFKNNKTEEIFTPRRTFKGLPSFEIFSANSNIPIKPQISPSIIAQHFMSEVPFNSFNEQQLITLSSPDKSVEIYYTTDGSNPNKQSNRYKEPFYIYESCVIKAVTSFGSPLLSRISSESYRTSIEAEPPQGSLSPGLNCYLYDKFIDNAHFLPNENYRKHVQLIGTENDYIDKILKAGVAPSIKLQNDLNAIAQRTGYSGYLYIEEDGVYHFYFNANPGCTFMIADTVLFNKRRIGQFYEWKEQIALKKGYHKIKVLYSDNHMYDQIRSLKILYKGPNLIKQEIDHSKLFHVKK